MEEAIAAWAVKFMPVGVIILVFSAFELRARLTSVQAKLEEVSGNLDKAMVKLRTLDLQFKHEREKNY